MASIEDDAKQFNEENPQVYALLVSLARRAVSKGVTKLGIGALWERLRWELAVETNGTEFRLNNNYRAFFSRLIMENEPDLAGIFEVRSTRRLQFDVMPEAV